MRFRNNVGNAIEASRDLPSYLYSGKFVISDFNEADETAENYTKIKRFVR